MGGHNPEEGAQAADRHAGLDALIHRAGVEGGGAPAGGAGHGDALRIDLRPVDEIVDGPHALPNHDAFLAYAHQQWFQVAVIQPVTQALSLSQGVSDQHHETQPGQVGATGLNVGGQLAVFHPVTGRIQHPGSRPVGLARPVEVGCHPETGVMFVDYLFDGVGRPLDGAHHLGIKGGGRRQPVEA